MEYYMENEWYTGIGSVQHTAFIGRDHVFNVYEGVFSACLLEEF